MSGRQINSGQLLKLIEAGLSARSQLSGWEADDPAVLGASLTSVFSVACLEERSVGLNKVIEFLMKANSPVFWKGCCLAVGGMLEDRFWQKVGTRQMTNFIALLIEFAASDEDWSDEPGGDLLMLVINFGHKSIEESADSCLFEFGLELLAEQVGNIEYYYPQEIVHLHQAMRNALHQKLDVGHQRMLGLLLYVSKSSIFPKESLVGTAGQIFSSVDIPEDRSASTGDAPVSGGDEGDRGKVGITDEGLTCVVRGSAGSGGGSSSFGEGSSSSGDLSSTCVVHGSASSAGNVSYSGGNGEACGDGGIAGDRKAEDADGRGSFNAGCYSLQAVDRAHEEETMECKTPDIPTTSAMADPGIPTTTYTAIADDDDNFDREERDALSKFDDSEGEKFFSPSDNIPAVPSPDNPGQEKTNLTPDTHCKAKQPAEIVIEELAADTTSKPTIQPKMTNPSDKVKRTKKVRLSHMDPDSTSEEIIVAERKRGGKKKKTTEIREKGMFLGYLWKGDGFRSAVYDRYLVGRANNANIKLRSKRTSREYAVFEKGDRKDGSVLLRVLSKTKSMTVNDIEYRHGSSVRLKGNEKIQFYDDVYTKVYTWVVPQAQSTPILSASESGEGKTSFAPETIAKTAPSADAVYKEMSATATVNTGFTTAAVVSETFNSANIKPKSTTGAHNSAPEVTLQTEHVAKTVKSLQVVANVAEKRVVEDEPFEPIAELQNLKIFKRKPFRVPRRIPAINVERDGGKSAFRQTHGLLPCVANFRPKANEKFARQADIIAEHWKENAGDAEEDSSSDSSYY